ncbi:MAG TPA: class I SAM-dependent methyltransferase [Bacteroidia bacterium]|jgi:SAM-dependent methyltransferase|nr:class I SAM-dependent methyltransferase [Bacteroidia bacterium]
MPEQALRWFFWVKWFIFGFHLSRIMFLISTAIDSYFRFRLRSPAYRRKVYAAALQKSLRTHKTGHILLRNLGAVMNEQEEYHTEFAKLAGAENYQKAFWESDLGYLWYEHNFNAANAYFDFAVEEISQYGYHSVLDVGCGWGKFCDRLAGIGTLQKVKGIDISADIIQKAIQSAEHKNAIFEYKDALQEQDSYDLITLFGSTDYIPPDRFPELLEHLLRISNREIILVNSLRGVPYEKALALQEALEVKRYDDGYVQPVRYLLEGSPQKSLFAYTLSKFGSDSVLCVIRKKRH